MGGGSFLGKLALDLPQQPPGAGAQLAGSLAGRLGPAGMGPVIGGPKQLLADKPVGLLEFDAGLPGNASQPLHHFSVELGVGGKADFGLLRRWCPHTGSARGLFPMQGHRPAENLLHSRRAQPPSEVREVTRGDRKPPLEGVHA